LDDENDPAEPDHEKVTKVSGGGSEKSVRRFERDDGKNRDKSAEPRRDKPAAQPGNDEPTKDDSD